MVSTELICLLYLHASQEGVDWTYLCHWDQRGEKTELFREICFQETLKLESKVHSYPQQYGFSYHTEANHVVHVGY